MVEIGYGLKDEYRHHGYMTEAVKEITEWPLSQDGVKPDSVCLLRQGIMQTVLSKM